VGGKALHPCASPLCMNPALSSPHNLAAPALIHSTPSQTRIAVQTMASSLDPFAHSQKEGLRRTDGSPRNGVKDSLINLSLRVLPLYSESVTDELWRSAWLSWSALLKSEGHRGQGRTSRSAPGTAVRDAARP
jgi:hypothetical protein